MAEGYKAMIYGLLLLVIFGFLIPQAFASFNLTPNNGSIMSVTGQTMANISQNGLPVRIPGLGITSTANATNTTYTGFLGNGFPLYIPSPLSLVPPVQNFVVTDFNGLSLYPDLIGIPIILLIAVMLVYGIVKLLPG